LVNVLHTLCAVDRQFRIDLNAAMKAAFGDEFEELIFPPAADQRVQLRVRRKSLESEVSTVDLSAGTLQFLFLITVLAMPSPPPSIVIEEPERYLHPSMLSIVAEHAVDAALRSFCLAGPVRAHLPNHFLLIPSDNCLPRLTDVGWQEKNGPASDDCQATEARREMLGVLVSLLP